MRCWAPNADGRSHLPAVISGEYGRLVALLCYSAPYELKRAARKASPGRTETKMCKHSLSTMLGAGTLAILIVLAAVGLWLGAGRTVVRIPVALVDTDDPGIILLIIIPGFSPDTCRASANPSPNGISSQDCVNNTMPGGPPFARVVQFAD